MLVSLLKQWFARKHAGANPVALPVTREALQNGASKEIIEGVGYQNSGQLERAEGAYRNVLRRYPDHFDALHLLGAVLKRQGRLTEAITTLRKGASLSPHNAEMQFNLADAYYADEQFSAAVLGYCKVVELDPQMAAAHSNLGNAYK